jgi:hypothetical protein
MSRMPPTQLLARHITKLIQHSTSSVLACLHLESSQIVFVVFDLGFLALDLAASLFATDGMRVRPGVVQVEEVAENRQPVV